MCHVLLHGRLLFSDATFAELHTRSWRPKFDRYLSIEDRKSLLQDFGATGVWVDVPAALEARSFSHDPDDDKFVQLALTGQATLLIEHRKFKRPLQANRPRGKPDSAA